MKLDTKERDRVFIYAIHNPGYLSNIAFLQDINSHDRLEILHIGGATLANKLHNQYISITAGGKKEPQFSKLWETPLINHRYYELDELNTIENEYVSFLKKNNLYLDELTTESDEGSLTLYAAHWEPVTIATYFGHLPHYYKGEIMHLTYTHDDQFNKGRNINTHTITRLAFTEPSESQPHIPMRIALLLMAYGINPTSSEPQLPGITYN